MFFDEHACKLFVVFSIINHNIDSYMTRKAVHFVEMMNLSLPWQSDADTHIDCVFWYQTAGGA